MPNDTRATLLRDISNFSTEEVVNLLQKNKLSECCDAVIKRQVDGEGLLQLSERNLNLWKSDLTESLRGSLCDFVEELNNDPEHYVLEYDGLTSPSPGNSDVLDDYWDTDFSDEEASKSTDEDSSYNRDSDENSEMYGNGDSRAQFRNRPPSIPDNRALLLAKEDDENDNFYANGEEINNLARTPVHATTSNVLGLEAELKLALERRNKPTPGPKPPLLQKTAEVLEVVRNKQSFLHSQMSLTQKNESNDMTHGLKGKQSDGALSMRHPMRTPSPKSKQHNGEQRMQQLNKTPSPELKTNIGAQRMENPNTRPNPELKPTNGAPRMQYLIAAPSPELKPNTGAQKMQQLDTTPSPEFKTNIGAHRMEHPNTRPGPESKPTTGAPRLRYLITAPSPESKPNIGAQKMQPPNTMPSPGTKRTIASPNKQPPERHLLPPKPKGTAQVASVLDKKARALPKPPSSPLSIRNLDLTSDHSSKQNEDSDDEYNYEPIKEQPTRPHHRSSESVTSDHSTQYLGSGRSIRGSNESVYHPPSTNSVEEHQDVYEVISEKEEPEGQDGYVKPIHHGQAASLPRPVRTRSPDTSSLPIGRQLLGGLGSRIADEVADMIVRIKRGLLRCCHAQPSESPEPLEPPKPPERPSRTFPLTVRQAGRPLPPTPNTPRIERPAENWDSDVPSYTEQPWFHNIDREEAAALIEGGSSKFSNGPPDGYFLLRPSTTFPNQPFTLVLWYKNRTWKLPVRKRRDNKFALGTVKRDEVSFETVEDLVNFHKKTVIPLKTGNADAVAGSTRLTESPPK